MGPYSNEPPEGRRPYFSAREAWKNHPGEKVQPDEEVTDKIYFTDMTRLMAELRGAVNLLPETRADKVRSLKQALAEGTYVIDSRKIAVRLIDETI